MTLPNDLSSITQAHIEQLVADQVREGPHLDFKRDLPTAWNDAAKHEFLADTTAFANSGGGDLIFGIDEDGQAQASSVMPQVITNVDQEIRRLQDFLLNLAEPRLPGVKIQAVQVSVAGTDGHVVVVRIPQSWAGPHRVKTNQHFFIRDGLRKRQLDVPEIRSLFLRTENQAQRLNDFRTERLGKILSGNAPQQLVDGPVLVAHLVPTQAALGLVQIDPVPYTNQGRLPVIGTSGGFARLNLDGALVVRNETPQGESHGYSQFFRNGFFESTLVLTRHMKDERALLPSRSYEEYLIALLGNFRGELDRLGINYECAVMLSLLRADEVKLGVRSDWGFDDPHQTLFDRKTLVLPDVVAPSAVPPDKAMKPAFDLMWQAAGFVGSRNYNNAGEWAPR
ncbi:MAG: ATP-binding protein [Candidatus Cloacimonetes bacterium]|nr:ATP-binding protein [Candidatus Cloacimonadota bacterium]